MVSAFSKQDWNLKQLSKGRKTNFIPKKNKQRVERKLLGFEVFWATFAREERYNERNALKGKDLYRLKSC